MGKKGKKEVKIKPFVSMCTPTFNRRPFIETLIKCINLQDYPSIKRWYDKISIRPAVIKGYNVV